ncbi:MAG: tyrosine-type recombinase/integrase [Deltaproteobacteria bacterium]|nr:tyrosine-type recombinase/integrase [Deltaproteobacteria bacterium]
MASTASHSDIRGLHDAEPHSLRHTFATLSLESGKSVKCVSQQLGHRDASLTLNVYAHALPDEETDLSYLPGSGGVTSRHQRATKRTQINVSRAVSS